MIAFLRAIEMVMRSRLAYGKRPSPINRHCPPQIGLECFDPHNMPWTLPGLCIHERARDFGPFLSWFLSAFNLSAVGAVITDSHAINLDPVQDGLSKFGLDRDR